MFQYAGAARFAYNWAVAELRENDLSESKLRKKFTKYKRSPENAWLKTISNDVLKQAIKDAFNAQMRYQRGLAHRPTFKSKNRSKPSFYQDVAKIKFTDSHVWIEKLSDSRRPNRLRINWIKLAEQGYIPVDAKYYNPRFTFDGLYWYISVSVEILNEAHSLTQKTDGIGVDLGVKDLAVCSDGTVYPNLNKTDYVRKLKKRERHLQRVISRRYKANNPGIAKADNTQKKGKRYRRSRDTQKAVKRHLKTQRRITNILQNHVAEAVRDILAKRPEFVVLEDLDIKDMLKNHKIAKAIAAQRFGLFRTLMQQASQKAGTRLIIAGRWFPSSKTCHNCGFIKRDLKLQDRTYHCPVCGLNVDRDLNAALNLRNYGYTA